MASRGRGQPTRESRRTGAAHAQTSIRIARRRFLQLAASSGLLVAGSGAWARSVLAQEAAGPSQIEGAITDLAAALGHDAERIFRFVADDIRYEPYAGILRGARGTLLSRAGNSADQALLLAELLRASGVPVRFVSGALDAATVDALMATTIVDPGTARELVDRSFVSDEDVAAGIDWGLAGVPAEELATLPTLEALRAAFHADRDETRDEAARQLQGTLDVLLAALGAAGIAPAIDVTAMPALEQASHTWVQAGDGAAWIDLDPSVPGAQPGTPQAEPDEPADALSDELRHRVDFTVTAESLVGGLLSQEPILEVSAFADEVAYAPALFTHVPADLLPASVGLLGGLGAGTAYNPVLVLGPDVFVGKRAVTIGGSGGGDLFGDALGGGGGEGLVEGETGAEWLEVRVASPGAEPAVARRAIFDRVGTAMRDSGAVDVYAVPVAELIDVGDGAGAHYLPVRSVRAFLVSAGTLNLRALIEGAGRTEDGLLTLIPGAHGVLRDMLGVDLVTAFGSRPFSDVPNIIAWTSEPRPEGYATGLDIWHRSMASVGLPGMAPSAPPAMVAGVAPHIVERLLLADGPVPDDAGLNVPVSVGRIFETAVANGVPIRAISGSLPTPAAYPPEIRAAIQTALSDGWVVVVPERVSVIDGRPRLGWWRIDPSTGAAVDERDDGAGATNTETTVNTAAGAAGGSSATLISATVITPAAVVAARVAAATDRQILRLLEALQRDLTRLIGLRPR